MHGDGPEQGPEQGIGHHDREPPLPPVFGETTDTPGRGGVYVYVKGELLVADSDRTAVLDLLRELFPEVNWAAAAAEQVPLEDFDTSKWLLPEGAPPVPEILDAVTYDDRGSGLKVSPNHVLAWNSHARFAPSGPPVPLPPNQPPAQQVLQAIALVAPTAATGPVRVGVLDTGVIPGSLPAARCSFGPNDVDRADRNNVGMLGFFDGHGTFVAGVVLQHTRNATVTVRRVQPKSTPGIPPYEGYTTDELLAAALNALRKEPNFGQLRVLNLSIGGQTHQGAGLTLTEKALTACRQASPDLVVVAGAGNDNTSAPFFPAAFKDVVAVAAIRDTAPDQRACFSNFGSWVDACAPGLRVVSSFLRWQNRPMEQGPPPSQGCQGQVPAWPAGPVSFDMVAEWRGTSFAAPVVAAWIANRITTANVPGAQAVADLKAGGPPGLGQTLSDLGRVVRPPF
jgi:Subtilase family